VVGSGNAYARAESLRHRNTTHMTYQHILQTLKSHYKPESIGQDRVSCPGVRRSARARRA